MLKGYTLHFCYHHDRKQRVMIRLLQVALVVEDKLLPHVWPFITQNVDSTEWRKRDAAIQATGSIIEGMVMAGDDARQVCPLFHALTFAHTHIGGSRF